MSWVVINTPTVRGRVQAGYESAADVFKKVMTYGLEDKVQVSAYAGGELVVDLVGTTTNSKQTYDRTSLQNVFSSSKAVSAIVMAMLVDRGLLTYDTPMSKIWPEFAQEGKQDVTIRQLMMHESGLQKFSFSLEAANLQHDQILHRGRNEDTVASKLMAAAKPKSQAGTKRAYHALTRGFLENEIVMRVDPKGRTMGEFLREEVAGPLGIKEEITLGEDTKLAEKRIHNLVPHSYWTLLCEFVRPFNRQLHFRDIGVYLLLLNMSLGYMMMRLLFGPQYAQSSLIVGKGREKYTGFIDTYNHPLIRSAEVPSANCHATAGALAKIASVMGNEGEAHGVRLMSSDTAALAQSGWNKRYDSVLWSETNFCQGGFCVFDDPKFACDRQGSIGWFGIGGSAMMWHRELKVGFGYTCTRLKADLAASNSAKIQNEILNCARRLQNKKEK